MIFRLDKIMCIFFHQTFLFIHVIVLFLNEPTHHLEATHSDWEPSTRFYIKLLDGTWIRQLNSRGCPDSRTDITLLAIQAGE